MYFLVLSKWSQNLSVIHVLASRQQMQILLVLVYNILAATFLQMIDKQITIPNKTRFWKWFT